ncbi:Rho-binding antiterminator [Methyloprofundus sp.]|uniref:Rho-binding antiterminator n=1 Tax=Methyloprofundus sp. TaxID=2020875 RepID=UPI003D13C655
MPKSPAIISCALHDYIEIACLYNYQIRLLLKNQQTIEGKAVDTLISADKREYLLLECERQIKIELIEIKQLQVLTPQAKFQSVSF